jgi:PadR family transcriptional regulator PadR
VPRNRTFSAQTIAVLAALAEQPSSWRHGYDLARETGLKSGTLYPILVRLADRELVEACWEEAQPEGRPRRHLYRLSADGLAAAAEVQADQPAPAPAASPARPAAPRRRTSGRLAGESS